MGRFNQIKYQVIENYMQQCMSDSAHDMEHIYRVLNYALYIAEDEENVDFDVLTAACLLHDIGRAEQLADPEVNHAEYGAAKAYCWLMEQGYPEDFGAAVKNCILTHRYRSGKPPLSIEAKILFDADKIEACGTIGIARTLLYKASLSEPLYTFNENGDISDGVGDTAKSFFQEYKFKLEKIYDKFYTKRGSEIAAKRKAAAQSFYDSMYAEVRECYAYGKM
jgi:uncharacterized protein